MPVTKKDAQVVLTAIELDAAAMLLDTKILDYWYAQKPHLRAAAVRVRDKLVKARALLPES